MSEEINFLFNEIKNDGLKREYQITVDSNRLDKEFSDRISEIGKTAKITGFRPGKVPTTVVEQRYGDAVKSEVLEKLINQTLHKFLHSQKLTPVNQPQIDIVTFEKNKDFEYKCSFEVYPEITLPEFSKLELEKITCEASDSDIQKRINEIAAGNKDFEESTKTKAEEGDRVTINFEGKIDGVAFEGGKSENFQLILGSKRMIDGFEAQIVGKKLAEKSIIKVTFPAQYHAKDLAGKDAEFEIEITKIETAKDSEINDEFAKKLGLESLDELKEKITDFIDKEWKQASKTKIRKDLFDALEPLCKFPIPESMFEHEFQNLWSRVDEMKKNDQEFSSKSDEELKAIYKKMSKRRVALGLLLSEVNKVNNIQVTQDELRNAVLEQARSFGAAENQVLNYYRNNPREVEVLRGPILEDKAVEFILSQIKLNEKKTDFENLLKLTEISEDDLVD